MEKLSTLSRSIEGKIVFITGAGNGMGRATAKLFAEYGAKVAASDLHQDSVNETVEEITNADYDARAWQLDVTDKSEVQKVFKTINSAIGNYEILISNAGVSTMNYVEDLSLKFPNDVNDVIHYFQYAKIFRRVDSSDSAFY